MYNFNEQQLQCEINNDHQIPCLLIEILEQLDIIGQSLIFTLMFISLKCFKQVDHYTIFDPKVDNHRKWLLYYLLNDTIIALTFWFYVHNWGLSFNIEVLAPGLISIYCDTMAIMIQELEQKRQKQPSILLRSRQIIDLVVQIIAYSYQTISLMNAMNSLTVGDFLITCVVFGEKGIRVMIDIILIKKFKGSRDFKQSRFSRLNSYVNSLRDKDSIVEDMMLDTGHIDFFKTVDDRESINCNLDLKIYQNNVHKGNSVKMKESLLPMTIKIDGYEIKQTDKIKVVQFTCIQMDSNQEIYTVHKRFNQLVKLTEKYVDLVPEVMKKNRKNWFKKDKQAFEQHSDRIKLSKPQSKDQLDHADIIKRSEVIEKTLNQITASIYFTKIEQVQSLFTKFFNENQNDNSFHDDLSTHSYESEHNRKSYSTNHTSKKFITHQLSLNDSRRESMNSSKEDESFNMIDKEMDQNVVNRNSLQEENIDDQQFDQISQNKKIKLELIEPEGLASFKVEDPELIKQHVVIVTEIIARNRRRATFKSDKFSISKLHKQLAIMLHKNNNIDSIMDLELNNPKNYENEVKQLNQNTMKKSDMQLLWLRDMIHDQELFINTMFSEVEVFKNIEYRSMLGFDKNANFESLINQAI